MSDKITDEVIETMTEAVKQVSDSALEAARIVEGTGKAIEKLKEYGIHYKKYNRDTNEFIFDCETHPNDEARRIFGDIGNTWIYHGATKKLIIGRNGKWERPELL